MPITDLQDIIKYAKEIGVLKPKQEEDELELDDSWLSQYKLKMDIIKKMNRNRNTHPCLKSLNLQLH